MNKSAFFGHFPRQKYQAAGIINICSASLSLNLKFNVNHFLICVITPLMISDAFI